MFAPPWTKDMVARLKALRAEGNTYSAIAITMSREYRRPLSRCSISGQVYKIRHAGAQLPKHEVKPPKVRAPSRGSVTTATSAAVERIKRKKAKTVQSGRPAKAEEVSAAVAGYRNAEQRANQPAPDSRFIPFMALTPSACKWPIGDVREPGFSFCGAHRDADGGGPYCEHHAAMAYSRPRPQAKAA